MPILKKLSAILSKVINSRGTIAKCIAIVLLICAAPTAQAEIYGSGVFRVGEGPVYSWYGSYVGTLVTTASGNLNLGYASRTIIQSGSNYYTGDIGLGSYTDSTGTYLDIPVFWIYQNQTSSTYNLNVSSTHGSVTKSLDLAAYASGTRVNFTAVPDEGYALVGWVIDRPNSGKYGITGWKNISLQVFSDSTVEAYFAPISREILLNGNALTWGQTVVGQSTVRSFTITNNGNSPLNITRLTFPIGYSGSFSGSILPNASATVQVTFLPTTAGTFSGNIVVESDATSGANTLPVSAVGLSTHKLTGSAILTEFYFEQKPIVTEGELTTAPFSIINPYYYTSSVQRTYWDGSIVHLEAASIVGYAFVKWTEDDKLVSTAPQFDLAINRDQTLVANYETEARGVGVVGNTQFGAHDLGSSTRKVIYLKNFGNTPAYVSGIKIFHGKGQRAVFTGNWSGWIQPKARQRVVLRFKPIDRKRSLAEIMVRVKNKTFDVINPRITGTGK